MPVCALAAAMTVGLGAQDKTVKSETKIKTDEASVVTMTGCLRQDTTGSYTLVGTFAPGRRRSDDQDQGQDRRRPRRHQGEDDNQDEDRRRRGRDWGIDLDVRAGAEGGGESLAARRTAGSTRGSDGRSGSSRRGREDQGADNGRSGKRARHDGAQQNEGRSGAHRCGSIHGRLGDAAWGAMFVLAGC